MAHLLKILLFLTSLLSVVLANTERVKRSYYYPSPYNPAAFKSSGYYPTYPQQTLYPNTYYPYYPTYPNYNIPYPSQYPSYYYPSYYPSYYPQYPQYYYPNYYPNYYPSYYPPTGYYNPNYYIGGYSPKGYYPQYPQVY